jgi:hypothetical protein
VWDVLSLFRTSRSALCARTRRKTVDHSGNSGFGGRAELAALRKNPSPSSRPSRDTNSALLSRLFQKTPPNGHCQTTSCHFFRFFHFFSLLKIPSKILWNIGSISPRTPSNV